jgi:glutamyl-tRNA synthetase
MNDKIRVRMAPSPTGFFHIGSARTALYNWLFARHFGGKFIIRVEDTDASRSSKEMIDVILDALRWLELDYDEGPEKGGDCGPYYQSERKELYHKYIPALIEAGHAYWCFCTSEEIAREREEAIKKTGGWQYDRRCLRLSADEVKKRLDSGMSKTLRFRIPDDRTVAFDDLVHGRVEKHSKELEDFIIIKSDGMPTYNYACVVDDQLMAISHVIRGVEHIANTPKQVLLYEALKWTPPKFAHLPVILGPDKKKLSKRLGARSALDYRDEGYLPETVVNILALLGWSPGGDVEIMDRKFMIDNFSLDRINPSNAVFDEKRLEWMNNQYIINRLTDERFLGLAVPYLTQAGLVDAGNYSQDQEYKQRVDRVCALMRARLKVMKDITKVRYFFADDFESDKKALDKHMKPETIKLVREYVADLKKLTGLAGFEAEALNKHLRQFALDRGVSPARIIHPLRVFITGVEDGPGLFEAMELIGKKRCLERIDSIVTQPEVSPDGE